MLLRASTRRCTLRLSKRWRQTKLLHHSPHVPAKVRIHDLAVRYVMDGDAIDGYSLVGCRNPHELPSVSAGHGPIGRYLFFLRYHVLDREAQIRIARGEELYLAFVSLGADRRTGKLRAGAMECVTGRNEHVH